MVSEMLFCVCATFVCDCEMAVGPMIVDYQGCNEVILGSGMKFVYSTPTDRICIEHGAREGGLSCLLLRLSSYFSNPPLDTNPIPISVLTLIFVPLDHPSAHQHTVTLIAGPKTRVLRVSYTPSSTVPISPSTVSSTMRKTRLIGSHPPSYPVLYSPKCASAASLLPIPIAFLPLPTLHSLLS